MAKEIRRVKKILKLMNGESKEEIIKVLEEYIKLSDNERFKIEIRRLIEWERGLKE